MMQATATRAGLVPAVEIERRIRERIGSLSYLPTTVAVALKFVELGKNPEAGPSDYAKVIGADTALSSKLLALANSPYYGVRNKVTSVRVAVNFLGLGTVRTLAISFCMAGLHNELKLSAEESRMFWEAALCKATAAQQTARLVDEKLGQDAFVAGMFQDFALAVMYVSARELLGPVIQDAAADRQAQLARERELCNLDHTEVGRMLAQRLELPDVLTDAIAFHHDHQRLLDFIEHEAMADAIYASSLFPPVLNSWNRCDAEELCRFLGERRSLDPEGVAKLLDSAQREFNQIYDFFEEGNPSENRLTELMVNAAREEADNTTELVRTVNQLMQEAASMGVWMTHLVQKQNTLAEKAVRDQLTGVLNREGFSTQAIEVLAKAARYRIGLAVVFLDVDRFKRVNDTFGHDIGDRALKGVADRMREAVRQQDLAGRFGGDEFVLLLCDCREPDAQQIVRRILAQVAAEPIGRGKSATKVTLSAGLLYVEPSDTPRPLDTLLSLADKLMYRAKQFGGNQVQSRTV